MSKTHARARRPLPKARSHPGAKMKKFDLIIYMINLIICIDLIYY